MLICSIEVCMTNVFILKSWQNLSHKLLSYLSITALQCHWVKAIFVEWSFQKSTLCIFHYTCWCDDGFARREVVLMDVGEESWECVFSSLLLRLWLGLLECCSLTTLIRCYFNLLIFNIIDDPPSIGIDGEPRTRLSNVAVIQSLIFAVNLHFLVDTVKINQNRKHKSRVEIVEGGNRPKIPPGMSETRSWALIGPCLTSRWWSHQKRRSVFLEVSQKRLSALLCREYAAVL